MFVFVDLCKYLEEAPFGAWAAGVFGVASLHTQIITPHPPMALRLNTAALIHGYHEHIARCLNSHISQSANCGQSRRPIMPPYLVSAIPETE